MTVFDAYDESTVTMYFNTQVYFRQHLLNDLANNEQVWQQRYHNWLAEQGCVIVRSDKKNLLRNSLGIAPGFDTFGFGDERDAVIFRLRWS